MHENLWVFWMLNETMIITSARNRFADKSFFSKKGDCEVISSEETKIFDAWNVFLAKFEQLQGY